MSYSKRYTIQDIWVKYIESQPEENRGYLYAQMFKLLKTGRKEEDPDETLSFLYEMMKPALTRIRNGRNGGKKQSDTKRELSRSNAEVKQELSRSNAEVKQELPNYQQVTEEKPIKKEKEKVSSPYTLSSKRNKKENYIKESSKEISATEQAFIDEFAKRFPRAMRMQKPLSYSEFCNIRENIVSEGHTTEEANRIITNGMERLENDPQLNKKYISANLVLQNWHRRGFLSLSKQ